MRTVALLACYACLSTLFAAQQTTPKPKQALTPQHRLAESNRLKQEARQAFDAEMGRADRKGGDCPNADSTRAQEECLSKELDITERNYKTFATALRALIAPSGSDEDSTPFVGPEGPALTPAQALAEFDKIEKLWQPYGKALCTAAFHEGGGGTISPVLEGECHLHAIRNHMRDLDYAFGMELESR